MIELKKFHRDVSFDVNSKGKDYFVGDIHGEYSLLMEGLRFVNFDVERDRLFATGDLIDRGANSYDCLILAQEPWFHSTLGNHETFALMSKHHTSYQNSVWRRNGGTWWEALGAEQRDTALNIIAEYFVLNMSVNVGDQCIGLVHAQYPLASWPLGSQQLSEHELKAMLWGRDQLEHNKTELIAGIDLVVVGHTPIASPKLLGNTLYIDTGSGYSPNASIFNPHLTLCEFQHKQAIFTHSSKSKVWQSNLDLITAE